MFILAPLKRRPIALLWGSQLLSSTAEELYRVALFWFAVTLVGSAAGYVAAVQQVTMFVAGLFGGVLVDRWNSRKAIMGADLARAISLLIIPVVAMIWGAQLWTLFVVAALVWGCRAVQSTALQTLLPRLEPSSDTLLAMNGLIDTTKRLARIMGPGAAGLIALFAPIEQFFTIIAAIFALSAASVLALKPYLPSDAPKAASSLGVSSIVRDFTDPLRAIRGHRLMVWSLVAVCVTNVLWTVGFTLGLVILVQDRFPGDVGAYGLIIAGYGVGNIVGNVILGSMRYGWQISSTFPGRAVLGLGFVGLAIMPDIPTLMVCAAIAAVGGAMCDLPFLGLMQREFAVSQIGRIYGLRLTVESAGGVIGAIAAAPLLAAYPAATVLAGSGIGLVLCGIVISGITRKDVVKRFPARDLPKT